MIELEENIMNCWNVTEDLDIIIQNTTDKQIKIALLGVKSLYQFKFEKLWKVFENHVHENSKKDTSVS